MPEYDLFLHEYDTRCYCNMCPGKVQATMETTGLTFTDEKGNVIENRILVCDYHASERKKKGNVLIPYAPKYIRSYTPEEIKKHAEWREQARIEKEKEELEKENEFSLADILRAKKDRMDREFEEFHNIDKWTKGYSW